jgi:hypothetical protein
MRLRLGALHSIVHWSLRSGATDSGLHLTPRTLTSNSDTNP